MKIGIDASRLKRKDRTGTENYLYFVLKDIFKIDDQNEYILYFDEIPSPILLAELGVDNKRIKYKTIKKLLSWTQISLAFAVFKDQPDILYCTWHTMPGIYPFWKTKIVSVIHDVTGRFIPTFWTLHFSQRIIAVSDSTKEDIVKTYRINPDKVKVIYEGYDNQDFYPRTHAEVETVKSKYGIHKDYVLFVGSIGPRKNLENMIEAFNSLNSNLTFVIGGSPLPGYEGLTKLPAQFIGRVEQGDLASLYTGAKLFAFVSKEEGFGIPILEAFACCVPVLTSNISSMSEVAHDSALLVNPNSIEDIANGMTRLLHENDLVLELVAKGMKRYKLFSWKKTAQETLAIFKEIHND